MPEMTHPAQGRLMAMYGAGRALSRRSRAPVPAGAGAEAASGQPSTPVRGDLTPRLQSMVDALATPSVKRLGALALVVIDGPLMADPYWLYDCVECLTHSAVARVIDQLAAEPGVHTIGLDLQCPGWSVAGSSDTISAITRASRAKRVVALVHDMAASGGAWMAALAEEVTATPTAEFGSIGTMCYMIDSSAAYEKAGLKVVAVPSPEGKAVGYPGLPITEEDMAPDRRIVEVHSSEFFAAVAKGRGVSVEAVRALNACMLCAKDALAARLIDRIETYDAAVTRLAGLGPRLGGPPAPPTPPPAPQPAPTPAPSAPAPDSGETDRLPDRPSSPSQETAMKTTAELKAAHPDLVAQLEADAARQAVDKDRQDRADAAKQPATFDELTSAFGDDPTFIFEAQTKKMTLPEAQAAYTAKLRADLKAAGEKVSSLEKKTKNGVEPLDASPKPANSDANPGGGKHGFLTACEAMAAEKKMTLSAAMQAVARKEPALHADYIKSTQKKKA